MISQRPLRPDSSKRRRFLEPHCQASAKKLSSRTTSAITYLGNAATQAFTIVEVMVAVLIMGITFASSAITMQVGLAQNDNARCLSYATEVLQNSAEDLRRLNWSAVQALPETSTMSISKSFQIANINTDRFTFTRIISDIDGLSGIKDISFIASWTSLKGSQHSRKLTTRYAKSGLYDYYYGINQ